MELWPSGCADETTLNDAAGMANLGSFAGGADYAMHADDDRGLDVDLAVRGYERGNGSWTLV